MEFRMFLLWNPHQHLRKWYADIKSASTPTSMNLDRRMDGMPDSSSGTLTPKIVVWMICRVLCE